MNIVKQLGIELLNKIRREEISNNIAKQREVELSKKEQDIISNIIKKEQEMATFNKKIDRDSMTIILGFCNMNMLQNMKLVNREINKLVNNGDYEHKIAITKKYSDKIYRDIFNSNCIKKMVEYKKIFLANFLVNFIDTFEMLIKYIEDNDKKIKIIGKEMIIYTHIFNILNSINPNNIEDTKTYYNKINDLYKIRNIVNETECINNKFKLYLLENINEGIQYNINEGNHNRYYADINLDDNIYENNLNYVDDTDYNEF